MGMFPRKLASQANTDQSARMSSARRPITMPRSSQSENRSGYEESAFASGAAPPALALHLNSHRLVHSILLTNPSLVPVELLSAGQTGQTSFAKHEPWPS